MHGRPGVVPRVRDPVPRSRAGPRPGGVDDRERRAVRRGRGEEVGHLRFVRREPQLVDPDEALDRRRSRTRRSEAPCRRARRARGGRRAGTDAVGGARRPRGSGWPRRRPPAHPVATVTMQRDHDDAPDDRDAPRMPARVVVISGTLATRVRAIDEQVVRRIGGVEAHLGGVRVDPEPPCGSRSRGTSRRSRHRCSGWSSRLATDVHETLISSTTWTAAVPDRRMTLIRPSTNCATNAMATTAMTTRRPRPPFRYRRWFRWR